MQIAQIQPAALEHVSGVIGGAYTGSALGPLFAEAGIPDASQQGTKWRRILENLERKQMTDRSGHSVAKFIQAAMNPVRFVGRLQEFEGLRDELNQALAFEGMELSTDGRLRHISKVSTLTEAEKRADRLRHELTRRGVHADVLRFCRAELLEHNFFHAVLEATKSLADKIRLRAELTSDGGRLVDEALGFTEGTLPLLAFNSLRTPTEHSEHRGIMNLLKGVFGAFRNPTAHEPKINWNIDEQEALDLLSMASLLHRRLDAAVTVPMSGMHTSLS